MNRRDFLKTVGFAVSAAAGLHADALAGVSISNSRLDARFNTNRPNLLLLMTDQHRADCLGCAGNTVVKTPNLDAIAADGVNFKSGYSTTPTCTPARSGLLTGLSPWHHGMLGYGRVGLGYKYEKPRMLREQGYYTFGIGKMHWFPQKTLHGYHGTLVDESGRVESPGFISDYRRWFKEVAPDKNPDATGIGWNDYRSGVYALPEELHPTTWTGTTACDFIENYDKSQPFMLKVSFARPHSPYDPPKRFMDMYDVDDMPAPQVGSWAAKYAPRSGTGYTIWHGDLGVQQAKISRHGYYGSVSFIDEQVGRIVASLKKKGIYDNTLIIFTADHGDMLGDHHLWRKSYPYEGSTKIPFLMKWHKNFRSEVPRGSVISKPVELRDVLPTFLDAANSAVPADMDGKSMLDLLRGKISQWREYIDLEHHICYSAANNWNALTDGKVKYVFQAYDGSEQLFNLETDPHELNDLAAEPAWQTALAKWRQRMVDHLSERGSYYVQNGRLMKRPSGKLYSPNYPS